MKIQTKFLDEIEIKVEEIINFPNGIPGFEGEKRFVLLPLEDESPFRILQSVTKEQVGFILGFPFVFNKDYSFVISDEDKEFLNVKKEEDVIVYSIVSIKEPFRESTLNLKAPLLMNLQSKIGKQIILHDEKFSLRYPIDLSKGEF
ncbi:flagellar assembly protein FliW [Robertmurraya massiliosenegalensis]|uniref:flagellar assembly protein FliW n=1 Tax=Robertmurraya massiliosenegalensis TaxID=1287657 RepID=UPI0002E10B18|nr:flagellar assembly protein FliW [Robertmurraya massiliosenegalensis]